MAGGRIEGSIRPRALPNRIYMKAPGLAGRDARTAAFTAVQLARQFAPRVSGEMAASFIPIYGEGYFGISWSGRHAWFQEMGIRPFTMHNLAGKTIPMWINDQAGLVRQANPKARTRVTLDGRSQTLIFRRAALPGQRKVVRRIEGGQEREVSVPMSYPGAPGRIARREPAAPNTPLGRLGGQIARGNVGVRWRHPGFFGHFFLRAGIEKAADLHAIPRGTIMYASQGVHAQRQRRPGANEPSSAWKG